MGDTVMLTDTDTPMLDILVTITAKGLLKPSPITVMLLMPTMVTVMAVTWVATVMASKFILLSFLSNYYYNGCVYKKFYNLESFDLRSTVPEVQPLAYKKEDVCLERLAVGQNDVTLLEVLEVAHHGAHLAEVVADEPDVGDRDGVAVVLDLARPARRRGRRALLVELAPRLQLLDVSSGVVAVLSVPRLDE